jgi:hypothetical protein
LQYSAPGLQLSRLQYALSFNIIVGIYWRGTFVLAVCSWNIGVN